jgi:hypothetical protein
MRQYQITIRPGSGYSSGRWLWFLDLDGELLASGDEAACTEAAEVAAKTLAFVLDKFPVVQGGA